jgi:hypothetical protein
MALQRMILVPPELWEKRSQTTPPPPVKKILDSNDHSYNKWTQVRLHQDPYLKTEKRKRDPIPIPIVETGGTPDSKPSFKTKAKRKRIIGSAPVFKTESTESETDTESSVSPVHSKYIQGVLRRKVSHDHTFGVYQDDANGSFKIGRSKFKFSNKHVFVDGRRYKATPGLWELLTKSRPNKDTVTNQDRQAYKQILLQSNAHRVAYSPTGRIRANKGVKYTRFISRLFNDTPKQQIDWETVE